MSAIGKFEVWAATMAGTPLEATGGMPLCPYARKALRDGKVKIEEMAYDPDNLEPIIERIAWVGAHPQYDVLILVHPGTPCDAKTHRRLEERLRPLALRLDQHTFGYHPDDPTMIAGQAFAMPVCALQFQPDALVAEARKKLLKARYYDQFRVSELKDLNFFSNTLEGE